jgi:peptidoglycan hydrolase-like protein with peptidoglycan-binding domain
MSVNSCSNSTSSSSTSNVSECSKQQEIDEEIRTKHGKQLLNELGGKHGESGTMDDSTKVAVTRFQSEHRLKKQDGTFSKETMDALLEAVAAKQAPQIALNEELQASKSSLSDPIDHVQRKIQAAPSQISAFVHEKVAEARQTVDHVKALLTLHPGESYSLKLEAEVRAELGVEGQHEITIKREHDGSYGIEIDSKGGVNLGTSEVGLHLTAGMKVKFAAATAGEAKQIGFILACAGAKAMTGGAAIPNQRDCDFLLKHTASLTGSINVLGKASVSLGEVVKTELGVSVESSTNVELKMKNGKIESVALYGETTGKLEGEASASVGAAVLGKGVKIGEKMSLAAKYELAMVPLLSCKDFQKPQQVVKITVELSARLTATKDRMITETATFTLQNPEREVAQLLKAGVKGERSAYAALAKTLRATTAEYGTKMRDIADGERKLEGAGVGGKVKGEATHTYESKPHALLEPQRLHISA